MLYSIIGGISGKWHETGCQWTWSCSEEICHERAKSGQVMLDCLLAPCSVCIVQKFLLVNGFDRARCRGQTFPRERHPTVGYFVSRGEDVINDSKEKVDRDDVLEEGGKLPNRAGNFQLSVECKTKAGWRACVTGWRKMNVVCKYRFSSLFAVCIMRYTNSPTSRFMKSEAAFSSMISKPWRNIIW